jgi:hypothetical protein
MSLTLLMECLASNSKCHLKETKNKSKFNRQACDWLGSWHILCLKVTRVICYSTSFPFILCMVFVPNMRQLSCAVVVLLVLKVTLQNTNRNRKSAFVQFSQVTRVLPRCVVQSWICLNDVFYYHESEFIWYICEN